MKNLESYWDNLIQYGIATEEELQLITDIDGFNEETFNNALYARTGYHNWEQFTEENGFEEE